MSMPRILDDDIKLDELINNLALLNDKSHEDKLIELEKILAEKNNQAEAVAKKLLGVIGWSKPETFDATLLFRIVSAIDEAGYLTRLRLNTLFANALFFANYRLVSVLEQRGYLAYPECYQDAESRFFAEHEKGCDVKKYLLVCRVFFEARLREVLQQIKEKIETYPFARNHGDDVNFLEVEQVVPTHISRLFKLVSKTLSSGTSLIEIYSNLYAKMIGELEQGKERLTVVGWFSLLNNVGTAVSECDPSTVRYYSDLDSMINDGIGILLGYKKLEALSDSVRVSMLNCALK